MRCWGFVIGVLLSGSLHAGGVMTLTGPVRMLPGNPIQGMHFDGVLPNDGGWFALACAESCTLQQVALQARPGRRDASATLEFSVDAPPRGRVVAYLNGLPGPRRPVTFLHAGMEHYPDGGTAGTLEITVRGAAGERMRIVPRVAPHDRDGDELKIYLENAATRQWLGSIGQPLQGARGLAPRDLLLWAGDLDGDGRVDLLMQFPSPAEGVRELKLFLSSAAAAGALVGEAGRYRQQSSGE